MSYVCTIGCKTCNYAPDGVRFYKKEDALAIIFHKQLIGDDADRVVRMKIDDEHEVFAAFFDEHQDHELVFIDHEGIHTPSIDDLPLTAVTYNQSSQN